MKYLYIYILSICLVINCFCQKSNSDSSFSDKKEAKNLISNSLKQGKWVEYYKQVKHLEIECTKNNASFYRLINYNGGKPYGVVKDFYLNGKLKSEIPYENGNISGIKKEFSENGTLIVITIIKDGKENGIIKTYYDNGKFKSDCPFISDTTIVESYIYIPILKKSIKGVMDGVVKEYYEDGILKSETIFNNGVVGIVKNYDTKGDFIK